MKFAPQCGLSGTYGRFVKAMSPYGDPTPKYWLYVSSCQAQNPEVGPKWSGCMPVADTITYCVLRFETAVVLPKCAAALTASFARSVGVAFVGAGVPMSAQTPASAPPVG